MIKKTVAYLIKFVLAPLWVVDGWLIAIVKEVPCGNETVTTCVPCSINSPVQANLQAEGRETDHCYLDHRQPISCDHCWGAGHDRLETCGQQRPRQREGSPSSRCSFRVARRWGFAPA